MTERDLKKLGRTDLLEMLIEQSKENEKLQLELEAVNAKLSDKVLNIDKAGNLAEACLQVNGVFEAAQAACLQYTENIKLLSFRQEKICSKLELETKVKCEQQERETEAKCTALERETTERCSKLEQDTEEKCSAQEKETKERCAALDRETTERCAKMERDMKVKCSTMLEEAKMQSEAYWTEVSNKIQELTKSYSELQNLWNKSPFGGK